ncbi:MATE family efflux transporter [Methanobrevibacter sp.]|uniref:MATE family efflux transporter n=1 Tax=Methanobrevibacter sp. TaxID=66852 RepID=UPI00388E1559
MADEKNIELIRGDPKKAIVKLSIPIMASMILVMIYNIADSIWVAGIGPEALAAIGFITPLFLLLVGLGGGIGAGANSLISRYIGAKDSKQANNAALHAVFLCIVISAVFTVLMILLLPSLLIMIGAGDSLEYALEYGYIIFAALFIFVYSNVASAIFRSEGDMRRATIAIAITAVLNAILDPIFIYVLNFGITGAAWATVFSAILSCLVMSYWIWGKKDLFLDLSLKNFSFDKQIIIDILLVAIPATLETIIFSALAIIINGMLVIVAGTTAVAVYTASMRIVQLAMIPLIGIGTAVITVAGVAYGARNVENLKTAHSYSIKLSFLLSVIIGVIMVVFSNQIASIFSYTTSSSVLAPHIATALSVLSLFVLAIPHGMMSSMLFQGVGKGINSLILTLLRSLIFESIFAYLFAFIFGWGLVGIYAGVVLGCFVGSTVGFIWAKIFIKRFGENLHS